MTEQKKPIYKIKFEVEIEITKEVIKTRRCIDKIGYSPKMHIKKDVLINDFDTANDADKEFSDRCSHIEEHFPDRIRLCYGDMFHNEGSTLNIDSLDIKSQARADIIRETAQMENQMQRQRLPTKKGRNPDKSKANYEKEREKFVNKSVEMLRTLKNEGVVAPTLTDLADKMFETYIDRNNKEQYYSYPLKEMGKKLDLYKISFEDLAMKYTNNVT
jgi:hypothetical protein